METNVKGLMFISYRRLNHRTAEALLLRNALRDRGIPTWRDQDDLESRPTEEEIIKVLADTDTAGAVLLVAEEVAESAMIQKVEAPRIFNRRHDNKFIIKPVLIGLGYSDADKALNSPAGFQDLGDWNLYKVAGGAITQEDARAISNEILQARLTQIANQLNGRPLDLCIYTRGKPAPEFASLCHDFTSYFDGRTSLPDAYEKMELALRDTANALAITHRAHDITGAGFVSLPAGVLFGAIFSPLGGCKLNWSQDIPGMPAMSWSLGVERSEMKLNIRDTKSDPGSEDLVLAIGISANIESAVTEFIRAKNLVPRALVYAELPGGPLKQGIVLSPSDGLAIALESIDAIRVLKDELMMKRVNLHLFLACPLALAVLLGQKLNTISRCSVYEHTPLADLAYRKVHTFAPSDLL